MGCLFGKQKVKNYSYNVSDTVAQQNQKEINNNPKNQKVEMQNQGEPPSEIKCNQLPFMEEDIYDLLTDNSLDDQEIYQIDESLRLRKMQLQKIKDHNCKNKIKSLNDINQVCKQETEKRRNSLCEVSNINISINNLYYKKFLSIYKVQEQEQQEQKNTILLDLDQSDQENEIEINSLENSFTSMKQLVSSCYYCKFEIQQDQYQLQCFHIYHTKCLEELIINQIKGDQTQIKCLCHQSIKTKLIKSILLINNDENNKQLLEKLFENQCNILISIIK